MKNTLVAFLICFVSINSYAETYTKSYCENKTYREKRNEVLKSANRAGQVKDQAGACRYAQEYIELLERCEKFWSDNDKDFINVMYRSATFYCQCANNPYAQGC